MQTSIIPNFMSCRIINNESLYYRLLSPIERFSLF